MLNFPLMACVATLRFEASRDAFRHVVGSLETVRAENRSARDDAASSRARSHDLIAWSAELRDARAAHPA